MSAILSFTRLSFRAYQEYQVYQKSKNTQVCRIRVFRIQAKERTVNSLAGNVSWTSLCGFNDRCTGFSIRRLLVTFQGQVYVAFMASVSLRLSPRCVICMQANLCEDGMAGRPDRWYGMPDKRAGGIQHAAMPANQWRRAL